MISTAPARMNSTYSVLAVMAIAVQSWLIRGWPVTSGVASTVRPSRDSTGLSVALTTLANQLSIACWICPGMSNTPGPPPPPPEEDSDGEGAGAGLDGAGAPGRLIPGEGVADDGDG